jgi:hypothetical protein
MTEYTDDVTGSYYLSKQLFLLVSPWNTWRAVLCTYNKGTAKMMTVRDVQRDLSTSQVLYDE